MDAESATLTYLAELRAALAGEVAEQANVEAVRAALLRIFERFTIHRASEVDLEELWDDDPFIDCTFVGDYVILVEPRPEAVKGLGDDWETVLRREPLGDAGDRVRLTFLNHTVVQWALREPIHLPAR